MKTEKILTEELKEVMTKEKNILLNRVGICLKSMLSCQKLA